MKRRKFSLSIFIFFCLAWVNHSSLQAQVTEDSYHQALRQQLADDYGLSGGEWLFFDAEAANANGVGVYGTTQKETVTINDQPFALAVRLTQSEQLLYPWDTGAVLANQVAITEGDVLLITFWARSVDAAVGTGYVRSSFQDRTTFESSISYLFIPSERWQQFFLPAQVVKSNESMAAVFGLQLGSMPQSIEIAGLSGINYGSSLSLDELPRTPNNQYAGQEADAAWRSAANQRIDKHRKADLQVTVVDRNGIPIPEASVGVHMQKHAFRFGTAVNLPNILGQSPDQAIYRSKLTNLDGNGHGFNAALLEWGLQWLPWEGYSNAQYTPERAREAFSFVKDLGMTMRAHSLVWGGWRWLPPDLEQNQDDPGYLLSRIDRRVETMLTDPGLTGDIYEWDVVNEPRFETALAQAVADAPGFSTDDALSVYIFKQAQRVNPNVRLFLNENSILSEGGMMLGAHARYHQTITSLIDAGARLDGIGLQGHMEYPLTAPERVYELLDEFAVYGRELHISEYDVEIDDEAKAGEYMRDFLTIAFSHPAVTGFTMWNFWDPVHWKRNAPLYRADWSLKPSGEAYIDLLFNQWWSDEAGFANLNGQYVTRAFLGDYQIEVAYGGTTTQESMSIVSGTNEIMVTLDLVMMPIESDSAVTILTTTQPTIDGEVEAMWRNAPFTILNNVVLGEATSADNLSASFRLLADATYLYVMVDVLDDNLQSDSGDQWWEDDAIEIYLDGDLSSGTAYDGENDSQFVFRWGDNAVISGPNSVAAPAGLRYALVQTPGGYRLEAAIPAADLAIDLSSGSQFGLDIHVIDDDPADTGESGSRDRKYTWHAPSDDAWQAPSLLGSGMVSIQQGGSGTGSDAFLPFIAQ